MHRKSRVLRPANMGSALMERVHVPKDTVEQAVLLLLALARTENFVMDEERAKKTATA